MGFATRNHYPYGGRTLLVIGRWTRIKEYDRVKEPLFLAENTTTANISLDKLQFLEYRKTDGIE